jgi:hypothetical protein
MMTGSSTYGVPVIKNRRTGEELELGDQGPILGGISAIAGRVFGAKNIHNFSDLDSSQGQQYKLGYWSQTLKDLSDLKENYDKKIMPQVSKTIGHVVTNSQISNVSNLPGINESLRQEISFLDKYNNKDYSVVPGVSVRDADGNSLTKVNIYKGGLVNDEDTGKPVKDHEKVADSEVIDEIKKAGVSINSGFGNIVVKPDGLYVKTNWLPNAQPEYKLASVVHNYIWAAGRTNLQAGQTMEQPIRRVTGGFKVGFDIIGRGKNYDGSPKPTTYHPWHMDPDGNKTYYDETELENQVSNQLMSIEKQMQQTAQAYHNRKR